MNLIGTFSFKFYSVHSVSVSLEEKQTNKKNLTCYSWNIHVYQWWLKNSNNNSKSCCSFKAANLFKELLNSEEAATVLSAGAGKKSKIELSTQGCFECVCVCIGGMDVCVNTYQCNKYYDWCPLSTWLWLWGIAFTSGDENISLSLLSPLPPHLTLIKVWFQIINPVFEYLSRLL